MHSSLVSLRLTTPLNSQCSVTFYSLRSVSRPTNDAEDAQYVGREDDQQVDEAEGDHSNGHVPRPVEGLVGEEHLLNGPPDLRQQGGDMLRFIRRDKADLSFSL